MMDWQRTARVFLIMLVAAALLGGCGRKLPPRPPGEEPPLKIAELQYEDDGSVRARVVCNVEDVRVVLLGKPRGLCPRCVDDLVIRDAIAVDVKSTVILRDAAPEGGCMVYRAAVMRGQARWLTEAMIICD